MTYMLTSDTVNTLMMFAGVLFCAAIACEWLKDDMKYLFQGVALLIDSALMIMLGLELFTQNIVTDSGSTMQFDPLGAILLGFGALCFILMAARWLPLLLKPYEGGADTPVSPRAPKRPMRPGGEL